MKISTGIAIKASIATIVLAVCAITTSIYEPMIGAKFAIDQLNDDYSSHAGVKLWLLFKNNWLIAYVVFVVALFTSNIKNLLIKVI